MSKKEEYARFEEIYRENSKTISDRGHETSSIYRDNETGVLYHKFAGRLPLTPLYGADGKVLVDEGMKNTSTTDLDEEEQELLNKIKGI